MAFAFDHRLCPNSWLGNGTIYNFHVLIINKNRIVEYNFSVIAMNIYLEIITREFTFTKYTRIEFAHGEATETSRKMTNTLADSLLSHRDTLSAVLAWIWITILHPIVRRCYQFHFIVYVFLNVVVVQGEKEEKEVKIKNQ